MTEYILYSDLCVIVPWIEARVGYECDVPSNPLRTIAFKFLIVQHQFKPHKRIIFYRFVIYENNDNNFT